MTLTSTLDELQRSIRTSLTQAHRSADIRRQSISSQYSMYQGRVSSTPAQERVLTEIGRQQEVKSGLYLMLLQKREENSIELAATADKGKVIDKPKFGGKVSPNSIMILLLALILGAGLPALVLYLLQFLKYKIEGPDDIAKITKLPLVAEVAVASESAKTAAGIVVHENQNDQIDEIFRSMRTNIQFMMTDKQKVILFSSTTSGEGKTFNAANLAVSFALLGKKVILLGLDIRKPALGRLFNVGSRDVGITNLLNKENVTMADVNAQVIPSGINKNLDLLLAGPVPPNPAELLARENLVVIFNYLKEEYDYLILDTAPVGLVTDTYQIAKYADVSVMICRSDYTPKANVAMLNTISNEKKMPNMCVVLNGVDMSKKKYRYYYGYGRYGKYGRYGYGRMGYGKYGYGNYGSYGNYASSHYGKADDKSIKK
jgi:capsular exopolysaccharide synthesis family protein